MCVKDEADILPQVYPHIESLVDHIYAYDDGSLDNTWNYIKNSDYAIRIEDDKNRLDHHRGNYHHLLERIKTDFRNEKVWCFLTMGDRFFLNKEPRQIVDEAIGYEAVEGVQLDFLRHKDDPWTEENDPFPDYSNIRKICKWARVDERCIVAFKLNPLLSYKDSQYPWPRGIGRTQYGRKHNYINYTEDMPYLEHQGRRSPKGFMWRYTYYRKINSKYKDIWNLSSFNCAMNSNKKWFSSSKVCLWEDGLSNLVALANEGFFNG